MKFVDKLKAIQLGHRAIYEFIKDGTVSEREKRQRKSNRMELFGTNGECLPPGNEDNGGWFLTSRYGR